MKKCIKRVFICLLVTVLIWCGTLLADRQRLNRELIRLHVVAASDSEMDQALKIRVRDAVVASLQAAMKQATDAEEAKAYLSDMLPQLEQVATAVLRLAGCQEPVKVELTEEAFAARDYDTFSLPAGVYETLRIIIGPGEGENWWCVVFPTLCLPATSDGFDSVAAGAGFPDALTGALGRKKEYEIRFFVLDALGKAENWLYDHGLHPVNWTQSVIE